MGEVAFEFLRGRKSKTMDGRSNAYAFLSNDSLDESDYLGLDHNVITGPISVYIPPPAYCCCTTKKLQNGKDELIKRYNDAKAYYDQNGAVRDPNSSGPGRLSCLEANSAILKFMSPTPPCWVCHIERRHHALPEFIWNRWNENAIVCESHQIDGKSTAIVFDWFDDRPPGDLYDNFVGDYPVFESRDADALANDCVTTQKLQPRNYNWLSIMFAPVGGDKHFDE